MRRPEFIYFWDDPVRHLRELHRVLADGGRLVIGFHVKQAPIAASFAAAVYTFYSIDEVCHLLERTGSARVDIQRSTPRPAAWLFLLPPRSTGGVRFGEFAPTKARWTP